jgi:hypothetical protein
VGHVNRFWILWIDPVFSFHFVLVLTSVSELARLFIALLNEGSYKRVGILRKESVDENVRISIQ